MTKREAVIFETHTGFVMLDGEDRKLAYEYAEELLGHPVVDLDFSDKQIVSKLKELSRPDFLKICQNLE